MIKLNSTTETITKVHYFDLDYFIQEVTGQRNYKCVAAQEWDNDSSHRFTVDGKLSEHDQKFWARFKEGKEGGDFDLGIILDGLCADKHIEPGTYLIQVSW